MDSKEWCLYAFRNYFLFNISNEKKTSFLGKKSLNSKKIVLINLTKSQYFVMRFYLNTVCFKRIHDLIKIF